MFYNVVVDFTGRFRFTFYPLEPLILRSPTDMNEVNRLSYEVYRRHPEIVKDHPIKPKVQHNIVVERLKQ
jgi:hypothetical protein